MKPWQKDDVRAHLRRFARLTLGECRFAARYGIFPLYALLALLYLLLLSAVAPEARAQAGGVILLTDPAAMGLFFMGAMVLLEKSQRVHWALASSPVREGEYIAAKVLALLCAGLPVGLAVGVYTGLNFLGTVLSLVLSSALFSLAGLWMASVSDSLNRFLLLTIPVELCVFTPALFYWYGSLTSPWWLLNPGVAAIALYRDAGPLWPAVASLALWNLIVWFFCRRAVTRVMTLLGGGRL